MELLNNVSDDETLEEVYKFSKSIYLKGSLLANLIYTIMWIAFDIFFIYIMCIENVSQKFWFVIIPICGLNIIKIWMYIFKVLKDINDNKQSGYALTDKAVYYYNDGKYKELKRISFEEIVALEKSEYYSDGFFVATLTNVIHVKNIAEQKELFETLTEKINTWE